MSSEVPPSDAPDEVPEDASAPTPDAPDDALDDAPPAPGFATLGLSDAVLAALDAVGYEAPSPVQARTIPPLLAGRDLLGQAQTGTGKTAAFALPILSRLDLATRSPQALVLTPTRELAIQVAEAFQRYASKMPGFHVLPIYGGQSYPAQIRPLERGVHVVVGTPGRVIDHCKRGTLDLAHLSTVVLDEADEMLRMGFIDDVQWILEQMPAARQTALFSATMPSAVRRIAQKHMRDPVEVTVEQKHATASTIRQRYQLVSAGQKLDALTRVLETETFDGVLVFVRTRTATQELAEKLEARGHATAALSGDVAQPIRERTVERLKRGVLDILVATDVAARGLDIDRISHVVNYDLPHDGEAYVHRIGRTGRMGRAGEAILFVEPRERRMLRVLERAIGHPIEPMRPPTSDDVNAKRIARFKQGIADTIAQHDLSLYTRLVTEFAEETGTTFLHAAAALAHLAQGGQPLVVDLPDLPVHEERPAFKGRDARERPAHARSARHDGPRAHGDDARRPRKPHGRPVEQGMRRWKLAVGFEHGVRPAQIVAALANEGGLDGDAVGRIEIARTFSLVDLPESLPRDVLQRYERTRICGRPIRMSSWNADGPPRKGKR
ncbi:MAG: DEAD/DEAH box helicase [Planctomycetes bacterium]|nr:DEAD/DEAH box helicase [Planctomycetota bacterium]